PRAGVIEPSSLPPSLSLVLRPGPERALVGPDAVAHAGRDRLAVVAALQAPAPLVERLDDLRREDRRGEKTLLAVDHQVEVDVATVPAGRRRVQVGDHVALAHLLALLDRQELLVEA